MVRLDNGLHWEYRAWERDPKRRVVAVVAALAAALIGFVVMHHVLFSIIGVTVIVVSTAELYFPVKYTLNENGAKQKCGFSVSEITWDKVARLEERADGVRLSPFDKPHRLDAFRGLFLRYSGNKDAILDKIAELWKTHEQVLGNETHSGAGGGID